MAVAFDAVSSATPTVGTTSPHTWTHTGVGSSLAVVAAICLDEATSSTTVACTYGGVSMTLIGQIAANNANFGILYLFGIANAPTGAQTVSFTFSGTTDVCVGASLSWTGAGATFAAAFGNFQPAVPSSGNGFGLAANPGLAVTCHSTTSQAFCAIASGASTITSMGGGAQRFLSSNGSSGDCGSLVGSNATGVNGNINFTSVIASGSYAIAGVEILPPSVPSPIVLPPQEAPGRKAPSAFRFRRPYFKRATPKIENLIDNFAANDLATLFPDTLGTVTWSSGQVVIKSDTSYDSALVTNQQWDLTGSSICIMIDPYVATSSDIQFGLFQGQFATSTNSLFCGFGGSTNFHVFSTVNGVQTNLFTTTYNATSMQWWRIRESGGTVFFDTAPDGLTWTNQFSTADTTFSFNLTSVGVSILGGDFGSDAAGNTTVFAVNTQPVAGNVTAFAGLASATGVAEVLGTGIRPTAEVALATGLAFGPTLTIEPKPTAALATGAADNPSINITFLAGLASGTGAANAPPPGVGPTPTAATATGAAFNATGGSTGVTAAPTAALVTGAAFNALPGVGPNPPAATATGAAFNTSNISMVVTAGVASAIGAALSPGAGVTPKATAASATGVANNPTVNITVTAGVAQATGAAFTPGVSTTQPAGLASATGAANGITPGVGPKPTAALATGAALTPNVSITAVETTATATGAASNPGAGVGPTPTVAVATGAAFNASAGPSGAFAGLASATGAAFNPTVNITVTAGVASATGAAFSAAAGDADTAGVAQATGVAFGPKVNVTVTAGVASATGIASSPGTSITVKAGLASATGTGFGTTPTLGVAPAVARAVGAASNPKVTLGVAPGVAQAVGAALNSTFVPPPRTPLNLGATLVPVTIDASLTRVTYDATAATVANTYSGGLVPVTFDATVTPVTYDATAATVANTYGGTITVPNFGAGVVPVTIDATLTLANFGGSAVTVANTYGGTITVPNFGAGVVPVTFDATLTPVTIDATAASLANTLGGTLAMTTIDASLVGWTMQVVSLTLAENNDESVNVAITQNGSPLSLSGATINMYLKTAAGTADGSALLLSTAGGSPAITITNSPGGLCTVAIPKADLTAETNNFYRIDVVFSGLQNTCVYGPIVWITL